MSAERVDHDAVEAAGFDRLDGCIPAV